MRSAMALGNVQHGEFTVTDEAGKATVMLLQRGEVTKVSDTSLSVKSADNFAGTYALNADTRGRGGQPGGRRHGARDRREDRLEGRHRHRRGRQQLTAPSGRGKGRPARGVRRR